MIPSAEYTHEEYSLLLADLLLAYNEASRHKRNTPQRLHFELRFEEELDSLARSILTRTYCISPCTCFMVTSPVKREIIAADFRDRVIHHYIHGYLNDFLERILIHDCYSCRIGKGTLFGVNRMEHHIRSCSHNYTRHCYVLQLDIKGYFMHINRSILYRKARLLMNRIGRVRDESGKRLSEYPKHEWISYLLEVVIRHNPLENCVYKGDPSLRNDLPQSKSMLHSPPDCGLPIGNLTLQLFSNLYLNDFDHYVKRILSVKHYGRYVDDFYLIDSDKEYLKGLISPIKAYLKRELHLELHPDKIKLQEAKNGVSFLGIHQKPYRRYLKTSVQKRIYSRVAEMNRTPLCLLEEKKCRRHLLTTANSYIGILNSTASYDLKKRIFRKSILFKIAYGNSFMQKFVMYRRKYIS